MPLHLVGESIDKHRGHYRAQTGSLLQLMRGIYVDADEDVDRIVLGHAVRIARYLYPNAYLSAASAILLAPTGDGRLYITGRRKQRTRLRSLEIVQNQAPPAPAVESALIADSMGEFWIDVSSLRQRLLEAFRLRSEHASSIDEAMRNALCTRLIQEYGDAQRAADAVWALARQNEWYREGELAERFLLRPVVADRLRRNDAELDLIVAWHGAPVGRLQHDGFEWRWAPEDYGGPPVLRQTTPGRLPPFIASLLPEGWLEGVLRNPDERTALRTGKRYMSNITVVERGAELATLPADVLLTRLEAFVKNGAFTGAYAGPARGNIEEDFERNLAQIYKQAETPRLSGVQIKAPMYLDAQGTLSPATSTPFTHILKPAGTSGFEALPAIEWLAIEIAHLAGFDVPSAALIAMPDGMPPALIVERFDIRRGMEDKRLLALEDLCSVMDLPSTAKYTGTIERLARAIRPLSTSPDADLAMLFRRALFAWLIADGDMHLKNLGLLKIAEPRAARFDHVRMAPVYDAVTTRVFPSLASDRLALKINGKDDRLRRRDFRVAAATIGLKATDADHTIDELCSKVAGVIEALALPPITGYHPQTQAMKDRMIGTIRERLATVS
jgi:serine/threonine-protein kinase HipA